MLYFFTCVCSVIRELSTKALHNLTPQAPDYMAATGKQCHPTCSPGNGENKMLMRDDFWKLTETYNFCSQVDIPWSFFLVGFSSATAVAHGSG